MVSAHTTSTYQHPQVHPDVLPLFQQTAEDLIANRGAVQALSSALALISGQIKPPEQRSLHSAFPGYTAILFKSRSEIRALSYVWSYIRSLLFPGDEADNNVSRIRLTLDKRGAVFDIPNSMVQRVKAIKNDDRRAVSFEVCSTLPPLAPNPEYSAPSRPWLNRSKTPGARPYRDSNREFYRSNRASNWREAP